MGLGKVDAMFLRKKNLFGEFERAVGLRGGYSDCDDIAAARWRRFIDARQIFEIKTQSFLLGVSFWKKFRGLTTTTHISFVLPVNLYLLLLLMAHKLWLVILGQWTINVLESAMHFLRNNFRQISIGEIP